MRWFWALVVALTLENSKISAVNIGGGCINEPKVRLDCYPPAESTPNVTEEACTAQGCCWKPLDNDGIPCAFDQIGEPETGLCAAVTNASRLACRNPSFFEESIDAQSCRDIGCCFDDDTAECFQPLFEGYELFHLRDTSDGWRGTLILRRLARGPFGNDISLLSLHVIRTSPTTVRVRIVDPSSLRFEVPDFPIEEEEESTIDEETASEYQVHFTKRPFGIAVTRRHTGEVLFNSTPSIESEVTFNGLVFENQYLEISTRLERHKAHDIPLLYGLGERRGSLQLRTDSKGDRHSLFSRTESTTLNQTHTKGEYRPGVHPFYLQLLDSGRFHGVFFLSSNAMEIVTQDNALTFRVIGGVLDFFVFTGPSAYAVTKQYTTIVGRPELPPYWALGYHLGRSSISSVNEAKEVVEKMRAASVPMDTYWQDVDILDHGQAFVVDSDRFPPDELQDFVKDLHVNNQYYVILQTPAISMEMQGEETDDRMTRLKDRDNASSLASVDSPLERGLDLDIFVKDVTGLAYAKAYINTHWSLLVDFFHPNASDYWFDLMQNFYENTVPFDGVWIDKSEVTNDDEATISTKDITHSPIKRQYAQEEDTVAGFVRTLDTNYPFDPYRQPFAPGQATRRYGDLNQETLPMAALHHSSLHYNLHSLYGHAQSKITRAALNRIVQKRSLLVARATYAGDGRFTGQWDSDSDATWDDLREAIPSVLRMNMLGMPLSGSNVCGSALNTTKELCIRWHQAASFFPLYRNHGSAMSQPHTPVDLDEEAINIIRSTLLTRYQFLPYMYSQFYQAHTEGEPVIRPLVIEYPHDESVHDLDSQYLVGSGLMVAPVLYEQDIATSVYFPNGTWYDITNGKQMVNGKTPKQSRTINILVPLHALPLYIRGGYVIPTQVPGMTTAMTKRGSYRLIVALATDEDEPSAHGKLFVDDGDSLNSIEGKRYSLLRFEAHQPHENALSIEWKREFGGYNGPEMGVDVEEITVFGVKGNFQANSSITVQGLRTSGMKVDYFAPSSMLVIRHLGQSIGSEVTMKVQAHPTSRGDVDQGNSNATSGSANSDERDHGGSRHEGPIKEEQQARGSKGITTIGIIGIVVGSVFLALLITIVLYRRRTGYNPIS